MGRGEDPGHVLAEAAGSLGTSDMDGWRCGRWEMGSWNGPCTAACDEPTPRGHNWSRLPGGLGPRSAAWGFRPGPLGVGRTTGRAGHHGQGMKTPTGLPPSPPVTTSAPSMCSKALRPSGVTGCTPPAPLGAVVTYTMPTVVEEDSPVTARVEGNPRSGSNFPIGTTKVTCTGRGGDDSNSPCRPVSRSSGPSTAPATRPAPRT